MRVLSAEQIRKVEEYEAAHGINFFRLMENAGSACARIAYQRLVQMNDNNEDVSMQTVAVVCGKGKNGGDGFVVARRLFQRGAKVNVILIGEPTAEDSIHMLERVQELDIKTYNYLLEADIADRLIQSADMVIDAIFGIGFYGEPNELNASLFQKINNARGYCLAIDMPSGLITDSGEVETIAVHADETVAITTFKPAHVLKPAREFCGKLTLVEIGISEISLQQVTADYDMLDGQFVYSLLKSRRSTANKGNFGHLLSICGSYHMPGAAKLVAQGALRSGVGLLTCAFPEKVYPAIASTNTEALLCPLSGDSGENIKIEDYHYLEEKTQKVNAIVTGCGLGETQGVKDFIYQLIRHATCPLLLDADALNVIADNLYILNESSASIVLTPHPGEMARLTGKTVAEIIENPIEVAKMFTQDYPVTLVLKGANTVIAKSGEITQVNAMGNAGMAKGGSGDLLSGIIASQLAQGIKSYKAACIGVFVHALAGDRVEQQYSQQGMTPSDMAKELRYVFKEEHFIG